MSGKVLNFTRELTRAELWAGIREFVAKQAARPRPRHQEAPSNPDDYLEWPFDLQELVPRDAPQAVLTAMASFAYFERGDGFRGRWMLTDMSHGAVLIAANEIEALQGTQNLMGVPMTLKHQGAHEPLNPKNLHTRTWAYALTLQILLGTVEGAPPACGVASK